MCRLLTRDGDTTVTLDARVAFANNHNGDLFLSLHGNAAPSSAVEGAEVYYLQLDRDGEQARAEAARSGRGHSGDWRRHADARPHSVGACAGSDTSRRRRCLPTPLSQAVSSGRIPVGPSPIRRAPLRVLEGVNMPAALVEVAYPLESRAGEAGARPTNSRTRRPRGSSDAIARSAAELEEHASAMTRQRRLHRRRSARRPRSSWPRRSREHRASGPAATRRAVRTGSACRRPQRRTSPPRCSTDHWTARRSSRCDARCRSPTASSHRARRSCARSSAVRRPRSCR